MRPHVLHVIDHTGSGGAQVTLLQILRSLGNEYQFSVAVLGRSGQFSDHYRALGVRVFELGSGLGRWNPLAVGRLTALVRRENVDLIHSYLFKSYILGGLAARWTQTRLILHDHTGIYPQSLEHYFSNLIVIWIYLVGYRYVLRSCDRILVLTPKDKRIYLESFSVESDKIAVLPNTVDPAVFEIDHLDQKRPSLHQELGLPEEVPLVAMLGRLAPQKDWWTFLKVAERVSEEWHRPTGFLVIGSGPEEARLREYVYSHNIENVFFLGYRDDVPSLLPQCDVFLLTSRRESFGLVILEAMTAGCGVVSTRARGPASIVTDGVNGLLADVGDVDGLADCVLRLLRDETLREKLVRRARRTVEESYSLKFFSTRLSSLYREVMGP